MRPYHYVAYVSQKESDDHDESYSSIVFAKNISSALRKIVKDVQKDGALREIGNLKPRSSTETGCPANESSEFTFQYFAEGYGCTAEIEGSEPDGLWVQIEVAAVNQDAFWESLDEDGEHLQMLKDWAQANPKAALKTWDDLVYAEMAEEMEENEVVSDFMNFLKELDTTTQSQSDAMGLKQQS